MNTGFESRDGAMGHPQFDASGGDALAVEKGLAQVKPTGSLPTSGNVPAADVQRSPVGRWWVPVLVGELRPPQARASQATQMAILRHRTDDESSDPLIIPSEWGVF